MMSLRSTGLAHVGASRADRTDAKWKAVVHNRVPTGACEAVETSRTAVPNTSDIASCRAIAHATVVADCDAPFDEAAVHVGRDVSAWWHSPRMDAMRRSARCRDDAFPRPPRRWTDAAMLMVTVLVTL